MTKLKAVCVDDDPFIHEIVKDLTRNSSAIEIIDTYCCPKQFLKALPYKEYDIFVLDIMMPDIDGLMLAKMLKGRPVIFITGEESYLKHALDLAPLDVLTKPLSKERFDKAIEKVKMYTATIQAQPEYKVFQCTQPKGKVNVRLKDIVYVKGSLINYRQKHILMRDGDEYVLSSTTFNELLSLAKNLVQVNKTELVSIDTVRNYEFDFLYIKLSSTEHKNKRVSLNRSYRKHFLERLTQTHMSITAS